MADRKKVLLVEDDEFTRFMMKEIIGTLGVVVTLAKDGKEGCETLADDPDGYGLILMDLHMPGMSGIDATDHIRSLEMDPPREVPIIAVTADVNYHDDARVEKLGMNGYASKPVSPGNLLKLIDRYCVAA
ncbi:response regulator [uncultured Tateyamaria sp.]|uniref:response regulator n=1 Tax=uncultured Tateyamaria sp. TaxID=455651 RepID=UPI0026261CC2|nr:response regulator [uncultured Tateyamaria sp.]